MVTPLPHRGAQVDQEDRQPVSLLRDLIEGRRARDQEHQVGVLGARDPHLLPVDDVAVAVAHRHRLELRRVGAGGRLGHAERLQPELSGRDLRQVLALLLPGAVPQQRAHDVHLRVACGGVAARVVHLFENDRRFRDPEPRAAVFLRNQRGQVARVRQRPDELLRIRFLPVEFPPVGVREPPAQLAYRASQILVEFNFRNRHVTSLVRAHCRRPARGGATGPRANMLPFPPRWMPQRSGRS